MQTSHMKLPLYPLSLAAADERFGAADRLRGVGDCYSCKEALEPCSCPGQPGAELCLWLPAIPDLCLQSGAVHPRESARGGYVGDPQDPRCLARFNERLKESPSRWATSRCATGTSPATPAMLCAPPEASDLLGRLYRIREEAVKGLALPLP
jgi:hypothetical protein